MSKFPLFACLSVLLSYWRLWQNVWIFLNCAAQASHRPHHVKSILSVLPDDASCWADFLRPPVTASRALCLLASIADTDIKVPRCCRSQNTPGRLLQLLCCVQHVASPSVNCNLLHTQEEPMSTVPRVAIICLRTFQKCFTFAFFCFVFSYFVFFLFFFIHFCACVCVRVRAWARASSFRWGIP